MAHPLRKAVVLAMAGTLVAYAVRRWRDRHPDRLA